MPARPMFSDRRDDAVDLRVPAGQAEHGGRVEAVRHVLDRFQPQAVRLHPLPQRDQVGQLPALLARQVRGVELHALRADLAGEARYSSVARAACPTAMRIIVFLPALGPGRSGPVGRDGGGEQPAALPAAANSAAIPSGSIFRAAPGASRRGFPVTPSHRPRRLNPVRAQVPADPGAGS